MKSEHGKSAELKKSHKDKLSGYASADEANPTD